MGNIEQYNGSGSEGAKKKKEIIKRENDMSKGDELAKDLLRSLEDSGVPEMPKRSERTDRNLREEQKSQQEQRAIIAIFQRLNYNTGEKEKLDSLRIKELFDTGVIDADEQNLLEKKYPK